MHFTPPVVSRHAKLIHLVTGVAKVVPVDTRLPPKDHTSRPQACSNNSTTRWAASRIKFHATLLSHCLALLRTH